MTDFIFKEFRKDAENFFDNKFCWYMHMTDKEKRRNYRKYFED